MPTPEEITKHHASPEDLSPWVGQPPSPASIVVVPYDEAWPAEFEHARMFHAHGLIP